MQIWQDNKFRLAYINKHDWCFLMEMIQQLDMKHKLYYYMKHNYVNSPYIPTQAETVSSCL